MKRTCRTGALALAAFVAAVGLARGEELRLEPLRVQGNDLIVGLVADGFKRVGSVDVTVRFDPKRLQPPAREAGALAASTLSVDKVQAPGSYRLALVSPTGISGQGALATLRFPLQGGAPEKLELGLQARVTDLDGVPIATQVHGLAIPLGERPGQEGTTEPDGPAEEALEVAATSPSELQSGQELGAQPAGPEPGETASDRRTPEGSQGPLAASPTPSGAGAEPHESETTARRREDWMARLQGYRLWVRFDPPTRFADEPHSPIRARIRVFRDSEPVPIQPEDLTLAGSGIDVEKVRAETEPAGLEAELRVDASALPARLDVSVFGLHESYPVPVYPRVDVDLDGSGTTDNHDYALLAAHFGARQGDPRYEARFDLVRDGIIDKVDIDAFRFNLVEGERERRLERMTALDHPAQESTQ